jgi:hypothetical protein
MPAHRHKTWGEASGLPETCARLDRLPEGLTFPDDFPEPIRFDPARKRLVYRGFMSSASYRFLHALSMQSTYVTALDELYLASAYVLARQKRRLRVWPWLLGAISLATLAALLWAKLR